MLKDSIALPRTDVEKKIHFIIDKSSRQKKEYLITKKRYEEETLTEDGTGRIVVEQNYLINNSEPWYLWSTIIMILPAVP